MNRHQPLLALEKPAQYVYLLSAAGDDQLLQVTELTG